jgi:hypothetical protein
LQLYLFPSCILIYDITGKHSVDLLYWQFCMFLQALCCFGFVLFKNNLFIKSTMFFYVSAFSLVALGFWILVEYQMICISIVFCGFITLLCSEKLIECMMESLFWSVEQLFLSFNESEDQHALDTFGVIDDLISFPVLFVCYRINYIFFVITYIEIFYPWDLFKKKYEASNLFTQTFFILVAWRFIFHFHLQDM